VIVKDKLHKDVLAWEVEIEDLNIDVENLDYKLQDGLFGKDVATRFENNDKELKKKVLKALDLEAIKIIIPDYNKIDIKIFKDLPGFKLWPHSDLRTHKAFIMINLVDNKNSTIFCSMEEEDLCKASNKKNNGVFHILHKGPIMHHVENNSNEDRYTTIAFIK
tara:strand:- start:880 stop:1368 length:489 start_codon:yes stop_codon:yes gene_type:complete